MTYKQNEYGVTQYTKGDARRLFVLLAAIDALAVIAWWDRESPDNLWQIVVAVRRSFMRMKLVGTYGSI